MSLKIMRYLLLLALITISVPSFAQKNFSFGIKGGVGISKIISTTNITNDVPSVYNHSYPLGFSFGIFIDNYLSKNISIVNEIFYQKSIKKQLGYTSIDGILDQKLILQNLMFNILGKFQIEKLWNIYALIGTDIIYLADAEYYYNDLVYGNNWNDKGIKNITSNMQQISLSIEFGLGKEINIYNKDLIIELRAQYGLNEFKGIDIGYWRNLGLNFLIGIIL